MQIIADEHRADQGRALAAERGERVADGRRLHGQGPDAGTQAGHAEQLDGRG
jgi:hypothetical protein